MLVILGVLAALALLLLVITALAMVVNAVRLGGTYPDEER